VPEYSVDFSAFKESCPGVGFSKHRNVRLVRELVILYCEVKGAFDNGQFPIDFTIAGTGFLPLLDETSDIP
jgi:hypothetical protein